MRRVKALEKPEAAPQLHRGGKGHRRPQNDPEDGKSDLVRFPAHASQGASRRSTRQSGFIGQPVLEHRAEAVHVPGGKSKIWPRRDRRRVPPSRPTPELVDRPVDRVRADVRSLGRRTCAMGRRLSVA